MYLHWKLSGLDASVPDKSRDLSGFGYLKHWYKCLEQATDTWACVCVPLSPVRVIRVSSLSAPRFFCALWQVLDIMYSWFQRTEYYRMLALCTGGRFQSSWSFSVFDKTRMWVLEARRSTVLHLCCQPSVARSAKSARSAAALSVCLHIHSGAPTILVHHLAPASFRNYSCKQVGD